MSEEREFALNQEAGVLHAANAALVKAAEALIADVRAIRGDDWGTLVALEKEIAKAKKGGGGE